MIQRIIKKVEFLFLIVSTMFYLSCESSDNGLIEYEGSPEMSLITVQQGTTNPKITWSGGFVSVIGVNKGNLARLDTSLIWLVKTPGNDIRYPIDFGAVPPNAQNIISNYGGTQLDKLGEDLMYTYWIVKQEMWSSLSNYNGKIFKPDPSLAEGNIRELGDTIFVSQKSFVTQSQPIDIYPNISELQTFGKLGQINVQQAVDEKGPIVTWTISQAGVTDTRLSAIGLVRGQSYTPTRLLWEVWSAEETTTGPVYGKRNVIDQPLYVGAAFDSTKVFQEFDVSTIQRNENYYIWIANESWNGTSRGRVVNYYAYATFKTW